jgi:predicted transcriptional regulator
LWEQERTVDHEKKQAIRVAKGETFRVNIIKALGRCTPINLARIAFQPHAYPRSHGT